MDTNKLRDEFALIVLRGQAERDWSAVGLADFVTRTVDGLMRESWKAEDPLMFDKVRLAGVALDEAAKLENAATIERLIAEREKARDDVVELHDECDRWKAERDEARADRSDAADLLIMARGEVESLKTQIEGVIGQRDGYLLTVKADIEERAELIAECDKAKGQCDNYVKTIKGGVADAVKLRDQRDALQVEVLNLKDERVKHGA